MFGLFEDSYHSEHQSYKHNNASQHFRLYRLANVISDQALQMLMGKCSKANLLSALMQEGLAMPGYRATSIHSITDTCLLSHTFSGVLV